MRIIICDDNKVFAEQMKKNVQKVFEELKEEKPTIEVFYSGEDLIEIEKTVDIAFVDVEMEGMSGITAARKLYEKNNNILIFVVTSYEDYIDEALKFHAYRYFKKPVNRKRLLINIKDALEIYKQKSKSVLIELKNGNEVVNTSEIVMIEAYGRNTVVYTPDKDLISVSSIQDLYSQIKDCPYFVQTHRSYIVNLNYVNSFDSNSIKILNEKYIAKLTKRNYASFKRIFKAYINK